MRIGQIKKPIIVPQSTATDFLDKHGEELRVGIINAPIVVYEDGTHPDEVEDLIRATLNSSSKSDA